MNITKNLIDRCNISLQVNYSLYSYVNAVQAPQCGFSAFYLILFKSRRQEAEVWCCGCVIAACGGSRGCISSCLASERVKGSGREA